MAWFKKTRKRIASSTAEKPSRVPEGLWVKCPGCTQLIYNKDLEATLNVCPKCAHHFRISATERLKALFDDGDRSEERRVGKSSKCRMWRVYCKCYRQGGECGA